jgi:hypothetical protein
MYIHESTERRIRRDLLGVDCSLVAYNGVIRQCLISSPNDIPENDLLIVHREIVRWNGAYGSTFRTSITPINWNINAAAEYGRPPQDIIDNQLVDTCDMAIALFATRLGTPTSPAVAIVS